ncbi:MULTISPECIES: hypothetical protein [unclassified Paenibacillus]|uniref:hypothetical protein n=1 Tax=unclassified Paenibacillus TaxID=185978 RepID=UPI00096EE73B|nr:hypothetical protein [Paenibacillus sp. FSL H8-0259]OMF32846.1 hypothetical protein BK132_00960 [Paenibacillus sp. FSL H8-0259]
MENIASFLKTTISILITLAIISSGLFLWGKTQPVVELANSQAAAQARALSEQQYSAFDNQLVSGSQILTAYRRYESQPGFCLYVQRPYVYGQDVSTREFSMNPSGEGSCRNFNYSSGEFKEGTSISYTRTDEEISNASGPVYVSPQSRYRAKLIKDKNERIAAIYFQAQ